MSPELSSFRSRTSSRSSSTDRVESSSSRYSLILTERPHSWPSGETVAALGSTPLTEQSASRSGPHRVSSRSHAALLHAFGAIHLGLLRSCGFFLSEGSRWAGSTPKRAWPWQRLRRHPHAVYVGPSVSTVELGGGRRLSSHFSVFQVNGWRTGVKHTFTDVIPGDTSMAQTPDTERRVRQELWLTDAGAWIVVSASDEQAAWQTPTGDDMPHSFGSTEDFKTVFKGRSWPDFNPAAVARFLGARS